MTSGIGEELGKTKHETKDRKAQITDKTEDAYGEPSTTHGNIYIYSRIKPKQLEAQPNLHPSTKNNAKRNTERYTNQTL